MVATPYKGSFMMVILLLVSCIPTVHSQAETDFPSTLSIDLVDGIVVNHEYTFKAQFTDELEPHSASWELFDSTSTRHYVTVSDFEQGITTGPSSDWTFEIEIFPEIIGACSCILIATVVDSDGISLEESRSVFIQSSDVAVETFTPTLYIHDSGIDFWHSQRYTLEALSSTMDSAAPSFSTLIRSSSTIKCTYDRPELENSLYAINHNSTQHPSLSDIAWDGITLTFDINLNDFEDGWHDVIIYAQSQIDDSTYSHDCISIRVDNTPPTVKVDIPESLPEDTGNVNLDASMTFDNYWGIQGLTYTWSVTETRASGEQMNHVLSGPEYRSIELYLVDSAVFTISLSVSDNAGNVGLSNSLLEVVNLPPVARLSINGEDYFDNDRITLSPESSLLVDASSSTDTSNDIDKLRYVWRIDNVPTYEGSIRTISWPDSVDGDSFVLSIEVIDDNAESTMISIVVVDSSHSGTPPASIVILILSVCFFSYSILRRSRSDDPEIPKWT